jgi:Flp pilus assembly protein TadD
MTGSNHLASTVAGVAPRARAIAARRRAFILVLLAATGLGGCASATTRGQAALYSGRYDEAASRFEEALTREPESVAALVGLGITRYRLAALDEARRLFGEALSQSPDLPVPHLYLGLIALLGGQDAAAAESLRRYVALGAPPLLAAHIERALRALGSGPVSTEMRQYMAAGIEDQSAWAGELVATRQALANAELRRITDDRSLLLLPRACRCR